MQTSVVGTRGGAIALQAAVGLAEAFGLSVEAGLDASAHLSVERGTAAT